MNTHQHPQLISTQQAADRLGVSPYTVKRWIRTGKLRGIRLGATLLRIAVKDLEALLQEGGYHA